MNKRCHSVQPLRIVDIQSTLLCSDALNTTKNHTKASDKPVIISQKTTGSSEVEPGEPTVGYDNLRKGFPPRLHGIRRGMRLRLLQDVFNQSEYRYHLAVRVKSFGPSCSADAERARPFDVASLDIQMWHVRLLRRLLWRHHATNGTVSLMTKASDHAMARPSSPDPTTSPKDRRVVETSVPPRRPALADSTESRLRYCILLRIVRRRGTWRTLSSPSDEAAGKLNTNTFPNDETPTPKAHHHLTQACIVFNQPRTIIQPCEASVFS